MEVDGYRALHRSTLVAFAGGVLLAAVLCIVVTARSASQDRTPRDPGYRLDVNTATAGELQTLPRIGPTTAEHIVTYREQHGPLRSDEQLDQVRLIGPVTLERIAPWITFR